VSGGFFAKPIKWLFALTLCFVCSTCTREMFEKLTFYGYVYDIQDHKPMPNTRVLINSCCGKVTGGCNFCLIAVAFTNADGYYAITRRAAKSDRYFFNFESEKFNTLDMNPMGSQFEVKYTGPDKNFRNDFSIGHVKYWHKVHIKNIVPFDANDRLVMHMPFSSGLDFRDTLVFKGTKVDTSIVIDMKFRTCCNDDPFFQSSTAVYSCDKIKNNTYDYILVDKGIKPRDTTFYEILY
jgi:hypothetical protein